MPGIQLAKGEKSFQRVVDTIRAMMTGRMNNVGTVTLTANAATTTVNSDVVGDETRVFLEATTVNAAAEVGNGTIRVSSVARGSFVITHANNAQVDRIFYWLAQG